MCPTTEEIFTILPYLFFNIFFIAYLLNKKVEVKLISNVTNQEVKDSSLLKELLIKQIESRVRWRENVNLMMKKGTTKFIEIGPGKVLSGLIKRIDKSINLISINEINDLNNLSTND